ncbi:hypothetical protein R0J87_22395, partial [Halomonas sp. SIMBA_159]
DVIVHCESNLTHFIATDRENRETILHIYNSNQVCPILRVIDPNPEVSPGRSKYFLVKEVCNLDLGAITNSSARNLGLRS